MSNELIRSFEQTIESADDGAAIQLLEDYTEMALDAIIEEDFLREIPIVKTIVGASKTIQNIQNRHMIKKICKFLHQLEEVNEQERKEFLAKYDDKHRKKMLDNLLLVLDKQENFSKADLTGKIFKAYIKGLLSKDEFDSMIHALMQLNLARLKELREFYQGNPNLVPETVKYSFIMIGLITISTDSIGLFGGGGPKYKNCELGEKFIDIVID